MANTDNLELLLRVRANTRILVSFGDCAITANIPGMRNMLRGSDPVLRRAIWSWLMAAANCPMPRESCRSYWSGCFRCTSWCQLRCICRVARHRPSASAPPWSHCFVGSYRS